MTRSPEQEMRHRITTLEAKLESMQQELHKTMRAMSEMAGAVQRSNDHFVRLGAEMQTAVDHMQASYAKLQPIVEVAKEVLMLKKNPTPPPSDAGGDAEKDHPDEGSQDDDDGGPGD